MATITMKVEGCRCERCGYEWVPRGPRLANRKRGGDGKPSLCPKCKSPYWQTKRKPPKGRK